jgi:hypothetical protein
VILAMSFALLATAVAWLAAPRSRPSPQVRTLIWVPPVRFFLLRGSEPPPELGNHQRTQAALVKSRLVLNSALRDPKVANLPLIASQVEPVEWLEKEVQVDFSVAPEIMRISMAGVNTEDLEVLVNAIRVAYLVEVVDKERGARRERIAYLGELIQKYEDQLKAARVAQRDIEEQLGGKTANVRGRMLASLHRQVAMTEGELLTAQSQLRRARIELEVLRARENVGPEKGSEQDAAEAQDKAQERREAKAQARRLETRIATLERTVQTLGPEVEHLSKRLAELAKKGVRLDAFREDISHIEEMVKRFKAEQEALRVEVQAPARVAVLEEATVSRASPEARDWALTGGAALAALCFALVSLIVAMGWAGRR